jgi:muramoyltetrapeptide carboxypeptidase
MPINFADNTAASLYSLFDAIEGKPITYQIPSSEINIKGRAEAQLVGGNISVLYSLLGSDIFPDTEGKILFLEDLDEYLYHIDRMMTALLRAGKLDNIKGLIVGGLTKMHDNNIPFGMSAEEIILEKVKAKNIPVCFGFPAGHIDDNRTLILGKTTLLEVGDTVKLSY